MAAYSRPFDVVHIAHTPFPDDQRPRREALLAAATGARVAVIAAQYGLDPRPVSRYGPLTVIRLPGERRRGALGKYVLEYTGFLSRAWMLMRTDSRLNRARLVHVHSLPDFLVAAALPARRRGARILLDLHEIFPEFMAAKFPGMTGRLAEPLVRAAERWSRRQADVVLTVNQETRAVLAARPARPGERLEVVHNTPDPQEFGPTGTPTGEIHAPLRLGYHGTLTPLYGLDVAIRAVHLAEARGVAATLDVFGDGPAGPGLRQLASELGVGDAVRFHGAVSHHVLRERLPSLDAGFLPTRLDGMTRFSLSTKLLEYVHLGVPLIASALPSYLRYFPQDSAWYFRPGDATAAVDVIKAFVRAGRADRRERAVRAQEAAQTFSWPVEAARLRAIYEDLLGLPRPTLV